jgi:hypothetical protein
VSFGDAVAAYAAVGFLAAIAVMVVEEKQSRRHRRRPLVGVYVLALVVMPVAWLPLFAWAAWGTRDK